MSDMEEFFRGLTPEDAKKATRDLMLFGTAFIQEVDGEKRRLDPSHVLLTGATLATME